MTHGPMTCAESHVGTSLGPLVQVTGNRNVTTCKDILDNCMSSTLGQKYMDVMVMCPHSFNHIVSWPLKPASL